MKPNTYIKIVILTLALFCIAATVTNKLRLETGGTIEFEGATNDNFETTVTVVDPTQDNVVTLQDSTGIIAFLSDVSSAFPPTGIVHVDAANTADASEDGSLEHPFDLIAEGIAASSVNNLIKIAGGAYAEALVVPHDLFVDGTAVTGLVSIDISSGNLDGLLGKIRYYAGGVLIYPVSNSITNGDCFEFAWQVSRTSAGADDITLLSGIYDVVARTYDCQLSNASNISVSGIGADKAHIITTDDSVFKNAIDNHLTNLELTADLNVLNNIGNFTGNSNIQHVVINGTALISNASFTYNGNVQSLTVTGPYTAAGPANGGDISNLTSGGLVTLNNYSADAHIKSAVTLALLGTTSGNIILDSGIPSFGGDITGSLKGIRKGSTMVALSASPILLNMSDCEFDNVPGANTFVGQIFKAASVVKSSRSPLWFQGNTIVEEGLLYERVTHSAISTNTATTENMGNFVFNHFIHDGTTSDRTGLAVSTGAHIHNSIFEDYSGKIAVRGRELLSDSVNQQGYGHATLVAKYIASTNTLVFPLTSEPQKSDGAGTGTRSGMDTDVFDSRVILVNDQSSPNPGENMSNVNGFVFEFIVFEDVDTTPADGTTDTFAYSTTVGVSIFVIHSTATDATQIDNLLSNPASDLTSATAVSYMGQAATITVSDTSIGGGIVGPEITIITQADVSQNYHIVPVTAWMSTDDVSAKPAELDDSATVGVHVSDGNDELLYAWGIPEGKKAISLDLQDAGNNRAIEVFEVTVGGVKTSKGTGNANTILDFTDFNASETTYLLIKWSATATSDELRWAKITLADQ